MINKTHILSDDIQYIEDILSQFGAYHFDTSLCGVMEDRKLSASELARRCHVSHTIIDKWKQGKAKPNGKERMKELGMALGMNVSELDTFLLSNGYPKLYIKNPLDGAARVLMEKCGGKSDIVDLYRALIERLGLSDLSTVDEEPPLATAVISVRI